MASTNKTSLGFNEWELSDKPRMEDFNRDNKLADQLITELREELAHKADDGAVQRYNLEIHDGYNAYNECIYFKSPGNIVTVTLVIEKLDGVFQASDVFATLPEGFRPGYSMAVPAMYHPSSIVSAVVIGQNGRLSTGPNASYVTQKYLYANFTFLAEN